MKNISFLFICLILFSQLPAASLLPQHLPLPLALVAEKNNSKRYYRLGDAVRIEFGGGGNSEKAKGLLTKISKDSIEVSSYNGKGVSHVVAIHSILSITPLYRKTRKVNGIIMAILAVIAGTLAIVSKGRIFESAWGVALFGIPLLGAAVYFLLFIGLTIPCQLLKKSILKGEWKFYSGEALPKRRKLFDFRW